MKYPLIFSELVLEDKKAIYIQIKDYIKELIQKGILTKGSKLPSTRELCSILKVSRNSIISAYEELESEGFITTIKGKGTFVSEAGIKTQDDWNIDWLNNLNEYAKLSETLDIVKNEIPWKKGIISFKSIAPNEELFDIEEFKKAFLNRVSLEGGKLLNYGYARGYKPLMEYLLEYMEKKGVNLSNKDIIITNGFTEGLELMLSALTQRGDRIICENPTHNTAIKLMKMHGLNIVGINMNEDGMDLKELEEKLRMSNARFGYIIPSYHNPTGIVMQGEKRCEVYNLFKKHGVPIIEDGFNEELLYSGSHVSPIVSLSGESNGVIYIGSFSKILFPGIRIGWILGDRKLISVLESVKRARNIHTSFLDQAILYDYLLSGVFEKYLKKIRKSYKERYEHAVRCIKKYIPYREMYGEGGLHIFIKLKDLDSRRVLEACNKEGVIFMPGDIFYVDDGGKDTLRLGISRLDFEDIEKGIKIIGNVIKNMSKM